MGPVDVHMFGVSCCVTYEEMPVYVGEVTMSGLEGNTDSALVDQQVRQENWLKRTVGGDKKAPEWQFITS